MERYDYMLVVSDPVSFISMKVQESNDYELLDRKLDYWVSKFPNVLVEIISLDEIITWELWQHAQAIALMCQGSGEDTLRQDILNKVYQAYDG